MGEFLSEYQKNELAKHIELTEKMWTEIRQNYFVLSVENIKSAEKWLFEVITISSVIMGFLSAMRSQNDILIKIAFFFFIITIFLGVVFHKKFVDKGKKELDERYQKYEKIMAEKIKIERTALLTNTQESYNLANDFLRGIADKEQIGKQNKLFNMDNIILIFFSSAMLLLFLSYIDFSKIFLWFYNWLY